MMEISVATKQDNGYKKKYRVLNYESNHKASHIFFHFGRGPSNS